MTLRGTQGLKPEDVEAYLVEHRDFFLDREELLLDMQLRHRSGRAVSLIERQVADLRQRNSDLRNRLSDLLARARENDRLIEKTRRLTLALLEANDLGDLVDALQFSLDREFGIQHSRLILIHHRPLACNTPVVSLMEAQRSLGRRLRISRVMTGGFEPTALNFLFGLEASQIGSAALCVMRPSQPLGLIVIGHTDPSHYKANLGLVFLSYLGQLLERLLPKWLETASQR